MRNATMTEIKHFENSPEVVNEFEIEMNLYDILSKEFEQGMPNELENPL